MRIAVGQTGAVDVLIYVAAKNDDKGKVVQTDSSYCRAPGSTNWMTTKLPRSRGTADSSSSWPGPSTRRTRTSSTSAAPPGAESPQVGIHLEANRTGSTTEEHQPHRNQYEQCAKRRGAEQSPFHYRAIAFSASRAMPLGTDGGLISLTNPPERTLQPTNGRPRWGATRGRKIDPSPTIRRQEVAGRRRTTGDFFRRRRARSHGTRSSRLGTAPGLAFNTKDSCSTAPSIVYTGIMARLRFTERPSVPTASSRIRRT